MKKGYTLIELLVVITIIVIFSVVVLTPCTQKHLEQENDSYSNIIIQ